MKQAYSLLGRWRSMDPEERKAVQAEARELMTALGAVKTAMAIQRHGAVPASWQAAVDRALNPGEPEKFAQAVVSELQEVPQATTEEIAQDLGAAGPQDTALNSALALAREDGYIKRTGVTLRGIKWDVTEWADRDLLDTPHVRKIEGQITDFVARFGIVSLEHVSAALGLDDDAPELRAALERALANGRVEWYCHGTYGLPPGELRGFNPPEDLWAQTYPGDGDEAYSSAVDRLKTAVKELADSMPSQVGEESAVHTGDAGGGQASDPADRLRELKELHEAGLLTDEEFEEKRRGLVAAL